MDPSALFIPLVVLSTTLLAVLAGKARLGGSASQIWTAVVSMFQCIGLAAIFYFINNVAGLLLVELLRMISGVFVSHYMLADAFLVPFSLLQALFIHHWITHAAPRPHEPPQHIPAPLAGHESQYDDANGAKKHIVFTASASDRTFFNKCLKLFS
jgi:hypothetical protein